MAEPARVGTETRRPPDPRHRVPEDAPVFVISVAAQLAGMHAQTLRQYDRLGLVSPGRTDGGGRRYSARDVALLREVQRLSQEEGVNLAGIKQIIELQALVDALRDRIDELTAQVRQAYEDLDAAIGPSTALLVWDPRHRHSWF